MEEVVGQGHIVEFLLSCKSEQKTNYPHLLFTGVTGIGKTFLAQQFLKYALRDIPAELLQRYILKLSSCDDRGIASLRQKLVEFLRSNRQYDVTAWVWIDDADSLPVLTQQALRRLMERYETHVRFLFSSCTRSLCTTTFQNTRSLTAKFRYCSSALPAAKPIRATSSTFIPGC